MSESVRKSFMGDLDSIPVFASLPLNQRALIYKEVFAQRLPAGCHLISMYQDSDIVFVVIEGDCQLHNSENFSSEPFCPAGYVLGSGPLNSSVTFFSKGAVLSFPKDLLLRHELLDHFSHFEYPLTRIPVDQENQNPPDLHLIGNLLRTESARDGLDLGSGGGRFALQLLGYVEKITLLDLDGVALDGTRKMLEWLGKADRCTLVEGDLSKLPFLNEQFDLVAARLSLHEVANLESVLWEANRVSLPNGRFIIADITPPCDSEGRNLFLQLEETLAERTISSLTGEEWTRLLHRTGFEVVTMRKTVIRRTLSSRPNAASKFSECSKLLQEASANQKESLGVEWIDHEPSWLDRRIILLAKKRI